MARKKKHRICQKRRKMESLRKIQGDDCAICGYEMLFYPENHPQGASLDHIIEKFRGGNATLKNLRLTHRQCNSDRSNQLRIEEDIVISYCGPAFKNLEEEFESFLTSMV